MIGYDCLSADLFASRGEARARIRELKDETPCLVSAEILSIKL